MNTKGGKCTAAAVALVNCRWIRHAVDGSDKEQQAYQTCDILELHSVLEEQKTVALMNWELARLANVLTKHKN
jgi:hypothetical protein